MSDARRRTIGHMRTLLTASAVVGVAMGARAQQQDDGGKPAAPKPDAGPPMGEGEWHMQHADPDAGNPGNNPGMGYGVVDPMPEPSRNRGCGCRKNDPYE